MNEMYKEEIKKPLDESKKLSSQAKIIKKLMFHRMKVSGRMSTIAYDLSRRGRMHDNSYTSGTEMALAMKIEESKTEVEIKKNKELLDSIHGTQSDYDPRFYPEGIHGMTLNQLIEFICDKIARYEEENPQQPGDDEGIVAEINATEYFNYVLGSFNQELPPMLVDLIKNTISWLVDNVGYTKSLITRKEMEVDSYVTAKEK